MSAESSAVSPFPSTSSAAAAEGVAATSAATRRLMSVDALRGFDMFWIIGADSLVSALDHMSRAPGEAQHGVIGFIAMELEHCEWAGFHFEDLIFPLFLFIIGVSLVFSLGKHLRQEGRGAAVKRLARRTILMYVVALFYYGGFANHWPDIRLMGVLQRLALGYCAAGLCFCFFRLRTMVGICAGLLIGYWALMTFVPIRDVQLQEGPLQKLAAQRGLPFHLASDFTSGAEARETQVREAKPLFYGVTNYVSGKFEPGLNLCNHIDFQYLPGKKWDTFFDPEGFLSTLPAIATCLLGVFAGLLLANGSLRDEQKILYLVTAGLVLVSLGWAWSIQFPVVKKIWTSSFVFVAGGYSALLLAAFYWIVDVAGFKGWCQPFVWMGMNSITIYLLHNFMGDFDSLSERFAGGDVHDFLERQVRGSGDLLLTLAGLAIAFWIVHFLYRRKIFLRL